MIDTNRIDDLSSNKFQSNGIFSLSLVMMSFVFDKILIGFGLILLLTLIIGTQAGVTYGVAYPDHLLVKKRHRFSVFMVYSLFKSIFS